MALPNPGHEKKEGTGLHVGPFLCGAFVFHVQKEEVMKTKISVLVLGAVLALSTSAWAQGGGAGGGAGGGTGGASGGAVGTDTGGGSGVGGRGAPSAHTPNVNPSNPSTLPQSNETPVSPGTGSGTNTR